MRLFLSALLLAALPAAFAQNQPAQPSYQTGVVVSNPGQSTVQDMKAQAEYLNHLMVQTGCPLYLSAASVAEPGRYLPVKQATPDDGVLQLHFRNQSGKAIRSASITATVKVKTNVYALDAHPIALQLTLSDVNDVNRDLSHLSLIVLPRHFYLFGVAQVSLDRVTYADGTTWTAPQQNNDCRTHGQGLDRIEAK